MAVTSSDLMRIDDTGTAHPVSRTASQKMRARTGTFRLMPGPAHVVFMRFVGDDGKRDEEDGAVIKLSGEIVSRGTLGDIVALISHVGWRGELLVLDGATSRSIFFDGGHVVGAHSTAPGERLGEIFYQFGALTEAQVEQCVAVEGKRVGDAAIELGLLTREKLFELMGKQIEEIVYKTLLVGDGMFYFLDRFDAARLNGQFTFNADNLLMESSQRMDEMSYFRERIPSDEHVPTRVPSKPAPTGGDETLLRVWQQIDGESSIEELGRRCELSLFETTRAVFTLCQQGLVQIRPPKLDDPRAVVELFNLAMRAIFKVASSASAVEGLKEELARFASGSGLYDPLFNAAGPEEDGSVQPERVVANLAMLAGANPIDSLCQWLYDYGAFALFVSGSLVSKESESSLAKQVGEILSPLRQNLGAADSSQEESAIVIELD